MDNFTAARSQMALSMAFHIIFSCIAMVMPVLMAVSHLQWLRTGKPIYKSVTKAWCKGVAIFFATGAVSGTVLSFEIGLLWPGFMKHAGPIFGMPFSLEGTAFFLEAIAFGFFLYGWDRFNRWFHWFTGLMVGLMGIISGILVVAANGWMNSPSGFDFKNGRYMNIDPVKALFNKAWFSESLHMTIAAFAATGFAVAGIHAVMILKKQNMEFHLVAFRIAASFAAIAAITQPLSGDISAKFVARNQPAKLAAMEANFKTERYTPLIIGGIPDVKRQKIDAALRIPGLLSFMVYGNAEIPVKGLDQVPTADRPPVPVVHYAFQIMVGLGMVMLTMSLLYFFAIVRKRRLFDKKWFLRIFAFATPIGFLAVEAGWTVTEVGRQPWVIQGVMRTSAAVTPMPGIAYSFGLFILIYLSLSLIVVFLLLRHIKMLPVTLNADFELATIAH